MLADIKAVFGDELMLHANATKLSQYTWTLNREELINCSFCEQSVFWIIKQIPNITPIHEVHRRFT